jgi:hypothetical protein
VAAALTGLLIEAAMDLPCHFGPERLVERIVGTPHSVDPVEAAQEAAAHGMAAIVLKGHEFPTGSSRTRSGSRSTDSACSGAYAWMRRSAA